MIELQIAGCKQDGGGVVKSGVSNSEAQFYAVCARESEGLTMWLADFVDKELAAFFVESMNAKNVYIINDLTWD